MRLSSCLFTAGLFDVDATAAAVQRTLQTSVPDLAAKAPPPAAGLRESDPSAQIHWMNRVAMVLDDLLAASAAQAAAAEAVSPTSTSPTETRSTGGGGRGSGAGSGAVWAPSPSACFQALLVHARRKGSLQGYYDAMLQRCVRPPFLTLLGSLPCVGLTLHLASLLNREGDAD